MAINFLNTVDFNKNQLNFARIQNLGTDPSAANSSIGQIYFNTTADTLKQYVANDGTGNPGWTEVGSTTVKAGVGIGVTFTGGEATVRNTGLVTVLDGTYIDLTKQGGGDNTQLTADLSAVDGTSTAADRFLTKNNKWATIPFGDITEVKESTASNRLGIDVVDPTGPIPIVGLDIVGRDSLGGAPAVGDELLIYDLDTTKNKKVTVANLKLATQTLYDLTTGPAGTTTVRLTDAAGSDDVTISGFSGQIAMSRINASELRVALTPSVVIANNLTLNKRFVYTTSWW